MLNKVLDKKRICFIVPSLQLGGQEHVSSIIATVFAKKNHDVKLLTLFKFPHFYNIDDLIAVTEPPFDKSKVNKLWYYLRVIFFLRKAIKSYFPDIIISFGDYTNILVLMACIGIKTKLYISDRASPDLKFQWYIGILRKLLYQNAYGFIAQTERAAQQKYKMVGKGINLKVIPNPVMPIRLFPRINRKNYILGIGRQWHVKGFDRLIGAFSLIKRYDYKILLAGSKGPATNELERIIENKNLKSDVFFLGSVTEVDRLYAECKIFVLPSRSEGFPNALIESMAAGLACISFDCSAGPREIITHGENGILVENDNVPKLAKQIQYLIDHESEIIRLGENAKKIREQLSIEKIGKQYMEFILEG